MLQHGLALNDPRQECFKPQVIIPDCHIRLVFSLLCFCHCDSLFEVGAGRRIVQQQVVLQHLLAVHDAGFEQRRQRRAAQ